MMPVLKHRDDRLWEANMTEVIGYIWLWLIVAFLIGCAAGWIAAKPIY